MLQELVDILLTEMISSEKQLVRDSIISRICVHSLRDVNPNELDTTKLSLKCEDTNRYYFNVTMKKGIVLTVPLDKRYIGPGIGSKMKYCFS